jgi:hypothetical protein
MATELHLALQEFYAGADGLIEAAVGGYRADVLREGVVYEIQTGNFTAIRDKLKRLLRQHPVVLVYPTPERKMIVQVDAEGHELSARRSPKRGRATDLFGELLHLGTLPQHRHLQIEVVVTHERELRCRDGKGSWRRRGVSLVGRELVEVLSVRRFARAQDLAELLPPELPREFTVADLRETLRLRGGMAGRMAYALRQLGLIEHIGKRGNAFVYRRKGRRRAAK